MKSLETQREKSWEILTLTASESLRKYSIKLKAATREAKKKAAEEMAKSIVEVILLRTRFEGMGLKGKLRGLSDSTIKQREYYEGGLSPETSPSQSNLTASGQLLDALKGKRVGSKVVVEIKNTKRKKGFNGQKSKITNKELRKYVEEAGREFLGLTKQERKEAYELATQIISDYIKEALN